jgi:hypothetical protein
MKTLGIVLAVLIAAGFFSAAETFGLLRWLCRGCGNYVAAWAERGGP